MDIAHRDHLLAAFHGVVAVAVLLLCLLAEVLVFALRLRTALYLVPVSAMLLLCFFRRRPADIGLVDFSCLKPPRRLRLPLAKVIENFKLCGCFNRDTVEFMTKAIQAGGMGNETYLPPAMHCIPPAAAHADAIQEAHALFFPTLDDLFAKTGVAPSAVGALIVNCSGFCPAPSLTAVIANHYGMRSDLKTFNLSGMGCSAGVVAVDVASSLLRLHLHSMSCAVVVSAEIFAGRFYVGNEHAKLLLNCYFRTGCSAALSAASLWYQLAYLEAKGRVREGDTVWQLGVGSGLKANSLVWQRVAGAGGRDGRGALGPWVDCIHRYPIKES
uniref:3-ketoacyl-CoA synthase 6 n=1 Tax=Aegilops tauschii TaxID=37682 RepID=N1R1S2_AEGTA